MTTHTQPPSGQEEKTRLIGRKFSSRRHNMLKDALNAVDAALGGRGDVETLSDPSDAPPSSATGQTEAVKQIPSPKPEAFGGDMPVTAPAMGSVRERRRAAPPAPTQRARLNRKGASPRYYQEPVVGWLVVVGGPGLGAFRPLFEGNNTIGRSPTQHVPIDFGDDAISAEEQAYIRYDPEDRTFLFIPNLAKTNVVSVNEEKPCAAIKLNAMDVITMGRTRLVFVPFCGKEFDWSELP